jgi:hypothetical protein
MSAWLISYSVAQTIGGAFALSAAQSGFINRMLNTLPRYAPDVDPLMVIGTGATQIRHVFPADQVTGIVLAYMAGLKVAFALALALAGVSVVVAALVPWKKLNTAAIQGGAA